MNDEDLYVTAQIPSVMPLAYRAHSEEHMRQEMGRALMAKLSDGQRYTVRIITDERLLPLSPYETVSELSMRAELSAVQMRHVVMPVMPDYPAMPWKRLSASALDEIKYRVRHWLKRGKP